MMIYITGDKYGSYQLDDISSLRWPDGQKLNKRDSLIVTGDFGGVFLGETLEIRPSLTITSLVHGLLYGLMVITKHLIYLLNTRCASGMEVKFNSSDHL